MIKSHKNVCVYGLGKFFDDVFEERNFKSLFGVNYLSDSNPEKLRGGVTDYKDIEFISPDKLKDIEDLIVIILIGGDTTEIQNKFLEWQIPYIEGFELLMEMSINSNISEDEFNNNNILEVFELINSEQSKEIYVEVLANRLAPHLRTKEYKELIFSKDYFDNTCYHITDKECFVDCGAFIGDTIKQYIEDVGSFEHIYSFEMDKDNYNKLLNYVDSLGSDINNKIDCYNFGVWNEKTTISYGNEEKTSQDSFSILKKAGSFNAIADKLDSILSDKKITFIKMDIEGAELKALMGAKQIIKEQKPKLAVCLYHKLKDFWEIPMYIKSVMPSYKLEIRHHYNKYWGTILYCE